MLDGAWAPGEEWAAWEVTAGVGTWSAGGCWAGDAGGAGESMSIVREASSRALWPVGGCLEKRGSWMDARVVGMSRRPDAGEGFGWVDVWGAVPRCVFSARGRDLRLGAVARLRLSGLREGGVLTELCVAGVDEG